MSAPHPVCWEQRDCLFIPAVRSTTLNTATFRPATWSGCANRTRLRSTTCWHSPARMSLSADTRTSGRSTPSSQCRPCVVFGGEEGCGVGCGVGCGSHVILSARSNIRMAAVRLQLWALENKKKKPDLSTFEFVLTVVLCRSSPKFLTPHPPPQGKHWATRLTCRKRLHRSTNPRTYASASSPLSSPCRYHFDDVGIIVCDAFRC